MNSGSSHIMKAQRYWKGRAGGTASGFLENRNGVQQGMPNAAQSNTDVVSVNAVHLPGVEGKQFGVFAP